MPRGARNKMLDMKRSLPLWITLCFLALSGIANAEKADQDKPIVLEAEKVSVNDVQQIYDLQGQILLIKGSIVVTGEDGRIQVDPEGYEFVDVKGSADSTASFRQRKEGIPDEYMQGRGTQLSYNAKTEMLTITGDASLRRSLNMQMLDQLQGWKIEYDDITERYRVTPPADAKPEDLPLARAILSPRRKATLEK